MNKQVPGRIVPEKFIFSMPFRVKVFVNCADKDKKALLEGAVKKGLQIVDVVNSKTGADVIVVDAVKALGEAKKHVFKWFILVPETHVKYECLPANVWVIPMDKFLDCTQNAVFMINLSEQKDLRSALSVGKQ